MSRTPFDDVAPVLAELRNLADTIHIRWRGAYPSALWVADSIRIAANQLEAEVRMVTGPNPLAAEEQPDVSS